MHDSSKRFGKRHGRRPKGESLLPSRPRRRRLFRLEASLTRLRLGRRLKSWKRFIPTIRKYYAARASPAPSHFEWISVQTAKYGPPQLQPRKYPTSITRLLMPLRNGHSSQGIEVFALCLSSRCRERLRTQARAERERDSAKHQA